VKCPVENQRISIIKTMLEKLVAGILSGNVSFTLLLTCAIVFLVTWVIYRLIRQNNLNAAVLSKIPGPPAWPLLGNALEITGPLEYLLGVSNINHILSNSLNS
jgi:hypothetical protein